MQDAQIPDKVDLERRAQGITLKTGAKDAGAGFAQERVVHGRNQGSLGGEVLLDLGADLAKNPVLVEMILGIEALIGRPVLLDAVLIAQQPCNGVAAEAHQLGKQVAATASPGLWGGETGGAQLDQFFDLVEEGGVFFRATGLGGTKSRERMR